jgi:PAS domain S-box-containing protein
MAIVALLIITNPPVTINIPFLLPVLNLVFLTGVSLLVAVLAARSALDGGGEAVAFLGGGTLMLGLGAAGAALVGVHLGQNGIATIYNLSAAVAALCHLISAVRTHPGSPAPAGGNRVLVPLLYAVLVALAIGIVAGAVAGRWPAFFVPGMGVTFFGREVLIATACMFGAAATLFWRTGQRNGAHFVAWYAVGLAFIAVGIATLLFQTRMGSAINWAARLSQYIGGVYLFLAIWSVFRQSHTWRLPLEEALRASEARVRESEERLRIALDAAEMGTWTYDFADGMIEYDARAQRLYGTQAPVVHHDTLCHAVMHPDDLAPMRARVAAACDPAGDGRYEIEYRIRRPEGGYAWLHAFGQVVFVDGRAVRMVGATRDVTERKHADEALRESEERFRKVWETTSDAMALSDADGIVQAVNPAYLELYGFTREEMLGQSFAIIFPPEQRAWAEEQYRAVFASDLTLPSYEATIRRADGTERHVDSRATFLTVDGARTLMLSSICDITERKQGEQEREALLAELEAVITHMADGLVVYSPTFEIQRLNPIGEQILGLSQTDRTLPFAERMQIVQVMKPDGTPFPIDETPSYRARQGEVARNVVLLLGHPDGQRQWVSASAAPLYDAAGIVRGMVSTFTDITAIHNMEEQMRTFVHLVSHDLRAPLTILYGHVGLVQEYLGDTADPLLRQSVEAIGRAAKRMDVMIEDLVTTARLEGGQLQLVRTPVALARWLPDFLARHASVFDPSRITVEMPDHVPLLHADDDRLERILTNLLSNALKYSGRDSMVRLRVQPGDAAVTLQVIDGGQGIAAHDVPHLFEKFYRAGSTRMADGIGLGLYITKMMVEAHGGTITVESTMGQGSTFTVTLPWHPA